MRRETQNILLILVGGALLKISFTGAYLLYVKPAHQIWLIGGGVIMVGLAIASIARDLLTARKPAPAAVSQPGDDQPPTAHTGSAHADTAPASIAQAGTAHASTDHTGHDHVGTNHAGHDHVGADHAGHDHVGADHTGHDHADDDHGGHHHPARSAWLLILPVLAIFLIAPPALGSDSVMRGDNKAAASRSAGNDGTALFPTIPAGDVVTLQMSDFAARAAWDTGKSLNDRKVRLTGFIVEQDNAVYLARLTIACCAADAFPIKVKLDGPGTAGLTNDMWVEVVGQVQPGTATQATDYVPTLTLLDTSQIPQPENPYEA